VQAQRVEQLAVPGGVCVTAAIHESLSKSMPFDLEDLGEQVLKGFDIPVRIYRVELTTGQSIPLSRQASKNETTQNKSRLIIATIVIALVVTGGVTYWLKTQKPKVEAASIERMALPLPDKPSIAVLPFTNMSNDAEQDFFAYGMTDDLITDISKISGLFVVSRNSVAKYKGKDVEIRQVAEELGVRYVMEGSVRRIGDSVRINAQLIDALTGGHKWAERYDGSLSDVFAMQDKIIANIVEELEIILTGKDEAKLIEFKTSNTDAYDAYLRGWERYRQGTPEDLGKSVAFFEEAINLDAEYAQAYSALAVVYWDVYSKGWWEKSLGIPFQNLYEASELARKSMRRAQQNPTALSHQVASESAAYFSKSPRRPLAEAQLAINLDPNSPAGHLALGNALLKANKPQQAELAILTAMRLGPHFPPEYLVRLAQAQFHLENYEGAIRSLERAVDNNPDDSWAFLYLAAAYGQMNIAGKATKSLKRADELRADAGWGPITIVATSLPWFKWQGKRNALKDGLRAAGAPIGGEWQGLISGSAGTLEVKGAIAVDANGAKKLYDRGVLFVNTQWSWFTKRIPGSMYLEWWQEGWIFNEVSLSRLAAKDREIVIHSNNIDNFSSVTDPAALAVSRGIERVYFFTGGTDAWEAAGYPIETGK
jgi:adenylate cyclase